MMISIEDARALYQGADAAHDFDHVLRVLALATHIASAEGARLDVVRTAALLHDTARGNEAAGGVDHALASAQAARALLMARGADAGFADAVADAIAAHRFRGGTAPTSLEARILYDADKLDAIGAVGIARAYAMAGRLGQRLWSDEDEQQHVDPHNPPLAAADHTPVREFVVKLVRLRRTLYTAQARRIAAGRHRFMVSFFDRLRREMHGEI